MEHRLGRAVVVGGGIGGLAAAGALAPLFREVEVFDRDDLPTAARSRIGTPQDRHSHGLLAGGLQALGQIFPNFQADLIAAGRFRSGSRRISDSRVRTSAFCRSATLAVRSSAHPGR